MIKRKGIKTMKKILNNDKKIAVACLLQLISLVVLCVREGVSSDGLEIIILLIRDS